MKKLDWAVRLLVLSAVLAFPAPGRAAQVIQGNAIYANLNFVGLTATSGHGNPNSPTLMTSNGMIINALGGNSSTTPGCSWVDFNELTVNQAVEVPVGVLACRSTPDANVRVEWRVQ